LGAQPSITWKTPIEGYPRDGEETVLDPQPTPSFELVPDEADQDVRVELKRLLAALRDVCEKLKRTLP
jgi:hypothetical protein